MLNFDNLYLGQRVKTGQQTNAQQYIIKRIDSDQRMVYIVPDTVSGHVFFVDPDVPTWGQWVSGEALFKGGHND